MRSTILGGIDVLVNNAGIGMRTVNPHFMTEPMGFWQVSPDGFRDLLATNVVGYFLVARAVVPHMLEAGHGKIVNISVSETTMRRRGFTPYGPSRAATDALSHIMAADLAGTGIDVNLLLPGGATRSGMTPDSAPEDMQATWLDPAIMGPPIAGSPPGPRTASPISASSRPSSRITNRRDGCGARFSCDYPTRPSPPAGPNAAGRQTRPDPRRTPCVHPGTSWAQYPAPPRVPWTYGPRNPRRCAENG